MTQELSTLLEDAAPTPRAPVDVDSVVARGRQLARQRLAAAAAVTVLVVIAGTGLVATLADAPDAPVVGEAPTGLPSPGTYEDGALVVGTRGGTPAIDVSVEARLRGQLLATLEGPADELAVATDGAIGVLTFEGPVLRIVRDGDELARTDVAPILEDLAQADPAVDDWPDTPEELLRREPSIAFDSDGTLWLSIAGPGGGVVSLQRDGEVNVTAGPQQEGQQLRIVGNAVSVLSHSSLRYGQEPAQGTVTPIEGQDPLAGTHPVPVPPFAGQSTGDRGTTIGQGTATTASILGAGQLELRSDPGIPQDSGRLTLSFVSTKAQVADTEAAIVHRTGLPTAVLIAMRDNTVIGALLDDAPADNRGIERWVMISPDGAIHLAKEASTGDIQIRTLLGPDLLPPGEDS